MELVGIRIRVLRLAQFEYLTRSNLEVLLQISFWSLAYRFLNGNDTAHRNDSRWDQGALRSRRRQLAWWPQRLVVQQLLWQPLLPPFPAAFVAS